MPYVDSPYGAIPTFELMAKFYDDIGQYLREQTAHSNEIIETEINKIIAGHTQTMEDSIKQYSKDYQTFKDIISEEYSAQIKTTNQVIVDQTQLINNSIKQYSEDYQSFKNAISEEQSTQIQKYDNLLALMKKQFDSMSAEINERQKGFETYVNQVYRNLAQLIEFIMNTFSYINQIANVFESKKAEYIDTMRPKFEQMVSYIKRLENILPIREQYVEEIEDLEIYEKVPIFLNPKNLEEKLKEIKLQNE
jgi:Fe2+ transport system protein B